MAKFSKRKRTRRTRRKTKKNRKVARVGTVKRMINSMIEHKWRSGVLNGAPSFDVPLGLCINAFAQSTARTGRLGNKIKAKSLEIGCVCAANKTTSTLRFMVFFDKQTNSSAFNINSVFSDGAPSSTNAVAPRNPDVWPSRFTLIYDKMVTLGISGGANDVNQERRWRTRLNLKNTTVQYNDGNLGLISDINKNALWLYIVSDELSSGGFVPNATIDYVLKFEDA